MLFRIISQCVQGSYPNEGSQPPLTYGQAVGNSRPAPQGVKAGPGQRTFDEVGTVWCPVPALVTVPQKNPPPLQPNL